MNLNNYYIRSVEFSSHINIHPKVYIESTDISNIITKATVDEDEEFEFEENSKIIIKVLLKGEYTISPLKIKLSIKNSHTIIIIVFIIIVLVIVITRVVIFFICKFKKNKENKRKYSTENSHQGIPNMPIIVNNHNNMYFNYTEDNNNTDKFNRQELNKLFNTKMKKHIYQKEYNQYGGGCSICLNKFDEKSEVSITSCNHVFHYKCIHNWLYKNIKNPRCPNCNNKILKDENYLDEKNRTNIIRILGRHRCLNYNNRLNQQDSHRRSITLNINNQSFNENSSQRKQIQEY